MIRANDFKEVRQNIKILNRLKLGIVIENCLNQIHKQRFYTMPSSVVDSFFYQHEQETLTIRYISGMVYIYKYVPENVFKEFKASASKGRYLNFHIKRKFKYDKELAETKIC